MAGQAHLVVNMLKNEGSYKNINICQDLAGIERFILAYRN